MKLVRIWTHARAIWVGLVAGLAALLIWPAHALDPDRLRPLFVGVLAVSTLSGASILWMGIADFLTVRRGRSVLPARIFDLALGLMLMLPSGLALLALLG